MVAVTLTALTVLSGCGEDLTSPSAGPPLAAQLTIGTAPIAPAIPDDFLGLGFETGVLHDPTLATNPALERLVANLGIGTLRFGGNSADHTYWEMAGPAPERGGLVLTAQDLEHVVGFARRVGWRLILDLNLRFYDPAAAGRAASGIAPIAGDRLLALEIGNEPNLYPLSGVRSPAWTVDSHRVEFTAYVRAIRAAVPSARIAGPATWGSDGGAWLTAFFRDMSVPVDLATDHFYPMGAPAPSSSVEHATLENMLSPALMARTAAHVSTVVAAAQSRGLALRIDESNSAYGFGKPGVSNVHASALWGLDHLWTLADHGAAGINIQTGSNVNGGLTCVGIYLPFCETDPTTVEARPLYYALLAFRAGAHGRPLPVTLTTSANASAHAALDDSGTLRITVIDKEPGRALALTLPAGGAPSASVLRLQGRALDAARGTSFAGAQVASDGTWSAGPAETVTAAAGSVTLQVPGAGAVVVVLEGFASRR